MREWFRGVPFESWLLIAIASLHLAIWQWLARPYVTEQIALGKYRPFQSDIEFAMLMLVGGHLMGRSVGKTMPLPPLPFWHAFWLAAGCFEVYWLTVATYFAGPYQNDVIFGYGAVGLAAVALLAVIGKRLTREMRQP